MHRALLLAFLTACAASSDVRPHLLASSPTHIAPVHVDAAFDEPDQVAIVDAVDTWNAALDGVVFLDARVHELSLLEAGVLIMRIDSSASYIPRTTTGRALAFTEYRGGRLVWLVRDRMSAAQVYGVTLHELGHVFGAADREGPGLMHWLFDPGQYRGIDSATVLEARSWLASVGVRR